MHTRAHRNVTSDQVSPAHDHSDDGAGGSRRQLHVVTLSDVIFALGSRLMRMADEGPRWHHRTHTEHVVHAAKNRSEPMSKYVVTRLIAHSEGRHERTAQ